MPPGSLQGEDFGEPGVAGFSRKLILSVEILVGMPPAITHPITSLPALHSVSA